MKIKEMIYSNNPATELLGFGVYNGYEYAIVSRGTHPCAYVRLPEGHNYYGLDYDEIPVDCHCGLTYSKSFLDVLPEHSGWWIGWNYGHCCDYAGFMKSPEWSDIDTTDYKKWTSSEIFEEVKQVTEQLKRLHKTVYPYFVPIENSARGVAILSFMPEYSKQAGKSLKLITEMLHQKKTYDKWERKAMKYLAELGSVYLALVCFESDFERGKIL